MRRLLEPQAAREAAPTGSSSLACWPKRIDATFGKLSGTDDAAVRHPARHAAPRGTMSLGASMAISAGSVFADASASSPMSPQLKSPGSVPTFNSPSESPAARKKWKPSPTLWQRLAAQAESIMHQVVTCCSKVRLPSGFALPVSVAMQCQPAPAHYGQCQRTR